MYWDAFNSTAVRRQDCLPCGGKHSAGPLWNNADALRVSIFACRVHLGVIRINVLIAYNVDLRFLSNN